MSTNPADFGKARSPLQNLPLFKVPVSKLDPDTGQANINIPFEPTIWSNKPPQEKQQLPVVGSWAMFDQQTGSGGSFPLPGKDTPGFNFGVAKKLFRRPRVLVIWDGGSDIGHNYVPSAQLKADLIAAGIDYHVNDANGEAVWNGTMYQILGTCIPVMSVVEDVTIPPQGIGQYPISIVNIFNSDNGFQSGFFAFKFSDDGTNDAFMTEDPGEWENKPRAVTMAEQWVGGELLVIQSNQIEKNGTYVSSQGFGSKDNVGQDGDSPPKDNEGDTINLAQSGFDINDELTIHFESDPESDDIPGPFEWTLAVQDVLLAADKLLVSSAVPRFAKVAWHIYLGGVTNPQLDNQSYSRFSWSNTSFSSSEVAGGEIEDDYPFDDLMSTVMGALTGIDNVTPHQVGDGLAADGPQTLIDPSEAEGIIREFFGLNSSS